MLDELWSTNVSNTPQSMDAARAAATNALLLPPPNIVLSLHDKSLAAGSGIAMLPFRPPTRQQSRNALQSPIIHINVQLRVGQSTSIRPPTIRHVALGITQRQRNGKVRSPPGAGHMAVRVPRVHVKVDFPAGLRPAQALPTPYQVPLLSVCGM